MQNIQTILVPTDFSPCADNAMIYAVEIAKLIKAQVILMRVYKLPETTFDRKTQEEYEAKFQQIRKDFFYSNNLDFDFELRFNDNVEEEIAEMAQKKDAQLIIMGAKGANAVQSFFGSTTTHVIRETKVPVLVIPENTKYTPLNKIVFACDYKKLEQIEPIGILLDFAQIFNAKIKVFNVNSSVKDIPAEEVMQIFRLDHYMEDIQHSFDFVDSDDVEKAIETYIQTEKVELLAMMPQKHNIFERIFKGSITDKLVFKTTVPILAFHK